MYQKSISFWGDGVVVPLIPYWLAGRYHDPNPSYTRAGSGQDFSISGNAMFSGVNCRLVLTYGPHYRLCRDG